MQTIGCTNNYNKIHISNIFGISKNIRDSNFFFNYFSSRIYELYLKLSYIFGTTVNGILTVFKVLIYMNFNRSSHLGRIQRHTQRIIYKKITNE